MLLWELRLGNTKAQGVQLNRSGLWFGRRQSAPPPMEVGPYLSQRHKAPHVTNYTQSGPG
jgi:hypothetical protein